MSPVDEPVAEFAQSWNPEIYRLTPVADWVVEAVPGETPEDESPLLYSEVLADEDIRLALAAVGDTAVRRQNGTEEVTVYDTSRIEEENKGAVFAGAVKVRADSELPCDVRRPVLDMLKALKQPGDTVLRAEPAVPVKTEGANDEEQMEAHKNALEKQLAEAEEYCTKRGTDGGLQRINDLIGLIRPSFTPPDRPDMLSGSRQFEEAIHKTVVEFSEDPHRLVEFLETILDMDALTRGKGPSSPLHYYLKGIITGLDEEFQATTYDGDDFKGVTKGWLSVYEGIDAQRKPRGRDDVVAEMDDDEIKEKATMLAMEFGFASIQATIEKRAYDYKHPEKVIDALYDLASAGLDLDWPNKINFATCVTDKVFTKMPIIGQYLKSAPELNASQETREKAMDLWFTLQEMGVSKNVIGLQDTNVSMNPLTRNALARALPSHKKMISKKVPSDIQSRMIDTATERVVRERKRFLSRVASYTGAPEESDTLYGRIKSSGVVIVSRKIGSEDALLDEGYLPENA
ncbi:MAG TPA: hypothetical protein VFK11_01695 [Candidatus Saccharimonadales bacterium]|nr:hypothetical protein [Candidatus Saccharimonadales bacterium]